jgi:hypothetical protein
MLNGYEHSKEISSRHVCRGKDPLMEPVSTFFCRVSDWWEKWDDLRDAYALNPLAKVLQ